MWSCCNRSCGTQFGQWYILKRHITKFDTVLLHSNWSSLWRKYWSKIPTDMNVLSCGQKASNISGISGAISPRYIRKIPLSMYARVPHGMAQFVLKKEKLSHIIGTAPILEMAGAYGLRLRLWLLVSVKHFVTKAAAWLQNWVTFNTLDSVRPLIGSMLSFISV